jgi:hypothetical protein
MPPNPSRADSTTHYVLCGYSGRDGIGWPAARRAYQDFVDGHRLPVPFTGQAVIRVTYPGTQPDSDVVEATLAPQSA